MSETAFQFAYGPHVICGRGASSRLADALPSGPVLFVTDSDIRALGLADAALGALGDRVVVFDAVEADPCADTVEAAVAAGRAAQVSCVVGFGGGSPMDVAKTAAYLLGSGDDLAAIYGVGAAQGKSLPSLMVPTTAGTGSEATPIAILTVGGSLKQGIVSPAITPGVAILDADLTTGLPRAVTAATGIDAMVHAIEAFTTRRLKNPISDALARQALGLLAGNIRRACDTPGDADAREAMLLGAHLAGVAFANAPVAGVHALAYPLGGHFHVPHGLSNAMMLPHVLTHNMAAARALYAELAPLVDASLAPLGTQERAQGLIEGLRAIVSDTGLDARLSTAGVTADDLDLLADEAMKQERLLVNNPVAISRDEARAIYEAAL